MLLKSIQRLRFYELKIRLLKLFELKRHQRSYVSGSSDNHLFRLLSYGVHSKTLNQDARKGDISPASVQHILKVL